MRFVIKVCLALLLVSTAMVLPAPDAPPPCRLFHSAGSASFYGAGFHGRIMANGRRFSKFAMTCAHKTLPLGTILEVVNPVNHLSVIVTVTDRGPYAKHRILDLSEAAAKEIGITAQGHAIVWLFMRNA